MVLLGEHAIPGAWRNTMKLAILNNGSCETFKAGVHGCACGLAALMALYNGAAWLRRRHQHLALNALIYTAAIFWECRHVLHHLVGRNGSATESVCERSHPVVPFAKTA